MKSLPGLCRALAACVLIATGSAAAQSTAPRGTPEPIDRVVAVVNSEAITLRELEQRTTLIERQIKRAGAEAPPVDVLKRQVLERMILERAQMQYARETGIRIDDALVDRAVARLAQDNGMTLAEFRKRVDDDGIPFSVVRDEIAREIVFSRLREREVTGKVQVSEAEVDALIAERSGSPQIESGVEYNVAQVLLRVPEGAAADEVERQRARAEEVLQQARSGADFGRLAATHSESPDAAVGGALGYRTADRLPKLFLDAVASLTVGQVADLVRSPAGFHVLKLVDKRAPSGTLSTSTPVRQTRARHILLRVNELNSEAEVRRRLSEIKQRVEAGQADFAEMARQFSVDGSAGQGGDLGWVYAGDTVPEFERAMNALEPNQVSAPVRTPFGWHLIQVLERRTDEASPERLRAAARQALRERKAEQAYEEWQRELRDRAYVEYRLEEQ